MIPGSTLLYRYQTHLFLIGALMYGLTASLLAERAITWMVGASFLTFCSQVALLFYYVDKEKHSFSTKRLYTTVFIYTLLHAALFMAISYLYTGDTYMFSKSDAMLYTELSQKFIDLGIADGIKYLSSHINMDDWGAVLWDALCLSIVPDKLFLNFMYILLGTFGSIYLFKIGRFFMSDKYAFLASLTYSTSSFWIFYHCGFLKETAMVFFIIAAMYHAYSFVIRQNFVGLGYAILFGSLLIFFRPAILGFLVIAFMFFYAIRHRKNALGFFLLIAALGLSVLVIDKMSQTIDKYTAGGDLDGVISYRSNANYSGTFNYFLSFIGAICGPFPTIPSSVPETPKYIQFYAPGLIVKLFLALPFWLGVTHFIRQRQWQAIPLISFILIEMLATAVICASMELRKVLPHIPFMYIASFYAIYKYDQSEHREIPLQKVSFLVIFLMLFVWNIIKVK